MKKFVPIVLLVLFYARALQGYAQILYGSPQSVVQQGPQAMLTGYYFFSSGVGHSQELGNNLIARSRFSISPAAKNVAKQFSQSDRLLSSNKSRYPYSLSDAAYLQLHSSYGFSAGAYTRLNTPNVYRVRGSQGNDKFQVAAGILFGYQEDFNIRNLARALTDLYLTKPFSQYNNMGIQQVNKAATFNLASYNYLATPFAYSRRGLYSAAGGSKKTKRRDDEFVVGITPYFLNGGAYAQMRVNRMQVVSHTEDKTLDVSGNIDYSYNQAFQHYTLHHRVLPVWENSYGYRMDIGAAYEMRRAMTVVDSTKKDANNTNKARFSHLAYRRTLLFSAGVFNIGGISFHDINRQNYSINAMKQGVGALRMATANAVALDSSLMEISNLRTIRKYMPELLPKRKPQKVWYALPTSLQASAEVRLPFSTHWYAAAFGRVYPSREYAVLNTYGGSLRYESKAMGVGISTQYSNLTSRYSTGIQARFALTRGADEQADERLLPVLEVGMSNVLGAVLSGEKYTAGVYLGLSYSVAALDRNCHPSIVEQKEQELIALRFKYDHELIKKAALEVRQAMLASTIERTEKRIVAEKQKIQRKEAEKAVIASNPTDTHFALKIQRIAAKIEREGATRSAMETALGDYHNEQIANAMQMISLQQQCELYAAQYSEIVASLPERTLSRRERSLNSKNISRKWKILLRVAGDVLRLSTVFW